MTVSIVGDRLDPRRRRLYDRPTATGNMSALRLRLRGRLITADDADYDEARRVLYVTVDRRPLAIARAADARDVAAVVDFARDHALPLAVHSGGHSLAYLSVIDDAIVVDLSHMDQVSIDPEARIARVQPGATSGDLAGPAHAHGLALSTGDTHSVGFGGLTTGGGNVGIVTEFVFRLALVGQVLGGELLLPASRDVLRGYLDYAASAPDDLTTLANLMYAPPAPHVPEERVGELALSILACWTGDITAGERALAPLRALATAVADTVAPIPYPEMYRFTAQLAEPHAASIRMMFADELSDGALDAALAAMERASSPLNLVHLRGLGGAMARVADDATAFAHRQRRFFVAIIGLWLDATEDAAAHAAWTTTLWRTIRPEGSGVYVNFLEDEGPERVREAYPAPTFARLAAIKRRYDPTNLFQFNQNVPPAP